MAMMVMVMMMKMEMMMLMMMKMVMMMKMLMKMIMLKMMMRIEDETWVSTFSANSSINVSRALMSSELRGFIVCIFCLLSFSLCCFLLSFVFCLLSFSLCCSPVFIFVSL